MLLDEPSLLRKTFRVMAYTNVRSDIPQRKGNFLEALAIPDLDIYVVPIERPLRDDLYASCVDGAEVAHVENKLRECGAGVENQGGWLESRGDPGGHVVLRFGKETVADVETEGCEWPMFGKIVLGKR